MRCCTSLTKAGTTPARTSGSQASGMIVAQPFRVDFDNVVFGLIDETTDDPDEGHGGPWAELYPQRLGFHEPWNGEYDT
jgi:hypothetical protein